MLENQTAAQSFTPLPPQLTTPEGSAEAAQIRPTTHGNRVPFVILGVPLFVCALIAVFYIGFVEPRKKMVKISRDISSSISAVQKNMSTVDTALSDMYAKTTNQGTQQETTKTLLRLNTEQFRSGLRSMNEGQVAGASTDQLESIIGAFPLTLKKTYAVLRGSNKFGKPLSSVLGASDGLESPRINMLRALKEVSDSGNSSAQNTSMALSELSSVIKNAPTGNARLLSTVAQIEDTNKKVSAYIVQAQRTTAYYSAITSIQIRLTPLLVSYMSLIQQVAQSSNPALYIDRIKEIETTMTTISKDIGMIKKDELPSGIESLHEDNIKVVDILLTSIGDIKDSLREEDYVGFLKAIVLLQNQIEPLSTRAINSEISFWQNNKSLRGASALTAEYAGTKKVLDQIVQENKIAYLAQ